MDSGNASVQPSLGLNWKGLTVYAWGSTEFREKNNEIDLSLEYEYKNLTLYANNYFTQTEEEPFKYFNYSSHSTGHTFEVGAGYMLSEKVPIVSKLVHYLCRKRLPGKRETCLVQLLRVELPVQREGCKYEYRSRFHSLGKYVLRQIQCSNIGLSATKDIKITSNFSLPIFGKLIANPYEEQLYFVVGITL